MAIKYRKGYKYQLAADISFKTAFKPSHPIFTPRIHLTTSGLLTVKDGYAWDGISGGGLDRKSNMAASLCHDALYQLMRMELLGHTSWRKADKEFERLSIACRPPPHIVKFHMFVLKIMKGRHARPEKRKKIHESYVAPLELQ